MSVFEHWPNRITALRFTDPAGLRAAIEDFAASRG